MYKLCIYFNTLRGIRDTQIYAMKFLSEILSIALPRFS